MEKNKITTIIDVAKAAGVSKGTVDRVIHSRGEVSETTRKKVQAAIHKLGFSLNIHASLLSTKSHFIIVVIMPNFRPDGYWGMIHDGLEIARNLPESNNFSIEIIYFNLYDSSSFRSACDLALSQNPAGVAFAPLYKEDSLAFALQLQKKKVPVVYIDSKLRNTNYLSYCGMPEFESGYLSAHLLFESGKGNSDTIALVTILDGKAPVNESLYNRLEGLKAYLKDHNLEVKIEECKIDPNNSFDNINILDKFFAKNSTIDKIITLHSRAYIVAEWLEFRQILNKYLVGFDGHKKNIKALKNGYITTLISEKTAQQMASAMDMLMRNIIFKHIPTIQDNYTSMDILNKYNVDYY